jgi:glucose/arabinose dehydrogenase
VFATGLSRPYGMALWPAGANPKYLYVANVNSIVRFPYSVGDLKAKGEPEVIVDKISDTSGGHVTRTLAFSKDDKTLFLSVGSATNVAEDRRETAAAAGAMGSKVWRPGGAWGEETDRAAVLAFDVDGKNRRPMPTACATASACWCTRRRATCTAA